MEQMDGVFCFPYFSGFMSASNHDNWDKALRNKLKKRKRNGNKRNGPWKPNDNNWLNNKHEKEHITSTKP